MEITPSEKNIVAECIQKNRSGSWTNEAHIAEDNDFERKLIISDGREKYGKHDSSDWNDKKSKHASFHASFGSFSPLF